jgi:subtilisin family serine protease
MGKSRNEDSGFNEDFRDQLARVTVPPELDNEENRKRWKLESLKHKRGPYLIELNVQYKSGLPGAANEFLRIYEQVCRNLAKQDKIPQADKPEKVGKSYYRCDLRVKEWRAIVAEDERLAAEHARQNSDEQSRHHCIYRLWPDFPVRGQISRSVSTIKADAALRSFEASGEEITWAVIDSGVLADHPHFGTSDEEHVLHHRSVKDLHRCFAQVFEQRKSVKVYSRLRDPDADPLPKEERDAIVDQHRQWALRDDFGHGTHVAGIITGQAPQGRLPGPEGPGTAPDTVIVLEREDRIDEHHLDDDQRARTRVTRRRKVTGREAKRFHGVAPNCRLISLRVLDENGEGRSSDLIRALEYVRDTLNDNPKVLRVHGVNLSVGYEFDAEMFACGQSPLCSEVNRLVQAGVVVVTAAGNTGYGPITASARVTKVGLSNTINDPGNAELAITVGATHREAPHTYGVSYFSSKGPTGDGRLKPDLVAPGERVISCAAGAKLEKAKAEELQQTSSSESPATAPDLANGIAYYVEDTGTSMAAPHVSGAIAAFLSIRREFIGRPLDVKRIFLASAIPLGRERYFEGHGLLDLMKAIQSV